MEKYKKIKIETDNILLQIDDVFLYRIPPNIFRKGDPECLQRAKDWDLENPRGTYTLTVVTEGDTCKIVLHDESGILFGHSPIDYYPNTSAGSSGSSNTLNSVTDSSRFFTLRIRNLSDDYSELYGIGFSSRNDSSDLVNALSTYFATPRHRSKTIDLTPPVRVKDENLEESEVQILEESNLQNNNPATNSPSKSCMSTFQYHCKLCSNYFLATEDLKKHVETKHEANAHSILFYCDVPNCEKRFLCDLTLSSHKHHDHPELFPKEKSDHDGLLEFRCKLCATCFFMPEELKKHIEVSHAIVADEILFYCDVLGCERRFVGKKALAFHKKVMHSTIKVTEIIDLTSDDLATPSPGKAELSSSKCTSGSSHNTAIVNAVKPLKNDFASDSLPLEFVSSNGLNATTESNLSQQLLLLPSYGNSPDPELNKRAFLLHQDPIEALRIILDPVKPVYEEFTVNFSRPQCFRSYTYKLTAFALALHVETYGMGLTRVEAKADAAQQAVMKLLVPEAFLSLSQPSDESPAVIEIQPSPRTYQNIVSSTSFKAYMNCYQLSPPKFIKF